jgi:hypothetical protein
VTPQLASTSPAKVRAHGTTVCGPYTSTLSVSNLPRLARRRGRTPRAAQLSGEGKDSAAIDGCYQGMKPRAARACARPLTAPSTMTLLKQPNRARCAVSCRIHRSLWSGHGRVRRRVTVPVTLLVDSLVGSLIAYPIGSLHRREVDSNCRFPVGRRSHLRCCESMPMRSAGPSLSQRSNDRAGVATDLHRRESDR